jgi:flagellar M-ring protein FliF
MADGALIIDPKPVSQAKRLFAQPVVQRSLPALGVLAVVGAAALAWSTISGSPQRDLVGVLSDSDKSAVATALDTAAVSYTLDGATGAIKVATSDYHKARMLLAAQGLPKSAPTSATMLDTMPMGSSHAVETERLRGARENDLARTIEAMDPVEAARVHLATGNASPFLRDEVQPSASVMLTMRGGRALTPDQVQAILHLVASSVSGLNTERVSLTDQSGRLLTNGSADGEGAAATRQLDIQARVEERYRTALAQLLTPLVGPDGFTAEVHADLDFAEQQSTRETFPQEQRAIAREESRWTSAAGEAPAVGIPGTLSNQPPPASTVSTTPPPATQPGATPPGRTSQDMTRSYELGREVAVIKSQVGTVKRLTVAVALRDVKGAKSRNTVDITAIDGLVKRAVGFDAARGDDVVVSSRPFAEAAPIETSWRDGIDFMAIGRIVAGLAAVAVVVFGIGRPFLKSRAKAAAERKAELAPMLADEMARQRRDAPITLDMISSAPSYADRAALVRDFVSQDPKRAAAVMRSLLEPEKAPERTNA